MNGNVFVFGYEQRVYDVCKIAALSFDAQKNGSPCVSVIIFRNRFLFSRLLIGAINLLPRLTFRKRIEIAVHRSEYLASGLLT